MTNEVNAAAPSPSGEGVSYPRSLVLVNNTPAEFIEPETLLHVPPYTSIEITFSSADQETRVQANLDAVCGLRGWVDGLVLGELEPEAEISAETDAAAETSGQEPAAAPKGRRNRGATQ